MVTDINHHVDLIKPNYPSLPVCLYGHSMGGMLSIIFLEQYPGKIDFALISAAPLGPPSEATAPLQAVIKVVGAVMPHGKIDSLSLETLCRSKEVVQAYKEDPLVWHGKLAAKTISTLIKGTLKANAASPNITLPLLYLQGTLDTMVPTNYTENWFKATSSKDKTLVKFIGWYHELHNEPHKIEHHKLVVQWLKERLGKDPIQCNSIIEWEGEK